MIRRFSSTLALIALLAGCKTGDNALATQVATASLNADLFASPEQTQTLTFVEGDPQRSKPLALQTYLYDKHYLECKALEAGSFNSPTSCTLSDAGRAFAHENGWTSANLDASCAACHTWTVPLATAKLASVSDIAATDKTHATAAYAFAVVPNAFGSSLGTWMASHAVAWCGVDPRAVGAWSQSRTGSASFEKRDDGWHVVAQPKTFDDAFAASTADATVMHPCAGSQT